MDASDRKFMEMAIEAARNSRGAENDPLVGAVAVFDGKMLGTAYRGEKKAGEHAEYTLLEGHLVNTPLAGATIYTTLEPCTTRNFPKLACVDRLILRKVSRVVIGMLDPNPLVSGLGYRKLREANIKTDLFSPDLMAQLEELNRSFIQSIKTDAIRRTTLEIAELATRSGIPRQSEAIGNTIRECLDSLRNIRQGEIQIQGREAGYFKRMLERIDEATGIEHLKAFVRLTVFEPEDLVPRSWFENFYWKLAAAVHSKKVEVEYIFLLRGREPIEIEKHFMDRFKRFAKRIATVYEQDPRLTPSILQTSMALMETQSVVFTHNRSHDLTQFQATEWIYPHDYERLRNIYEQIELMSTIYYSRDSSEVDFVRNQADVHDPDPALNGEMTVEEADIETVVSSITTERPNLADHVAPDGTVTILFSDIVGSTMINDQIGDAKWMDVLREHDEIVRRLLLSHRGYEVKTVGDAFMIAFQSGRDALNCAISIQRAFANRNKTVEPTIRLRIGLHAGELVRKADDFFGRHVNFAARIASSAMADEILVSSLLHDIVNPSGEFSFAFQRSKTLKGFKGKHKLYSVRWADD